jgi:alpha-glucosidase
MECGTIRVRISSLKKLPPWRSEAVVGRNGSGGFSLLQNGVIGTPAGLNVYLRPEELSLVFFRPDGSCIAADQKIGLRSNLIVVRKVLRPEERVYGLGEKTGWLDKRGRRYTIIAPGVIPFASRFPVIRQYNRWKSPKSPQPPFR